MIAAYEADTRDEAYLSPRQYGLTQSHKHLPEMQGICGLDTAPIFCPVVADYPRGMATTVPVFSSRLRPGITPEDLKNAYAAFYDGQKNITVMDSQPEDGFLAANAVVGTNELQIFVMGGPDRILLTSRFDNLGKGASGAAIQNMNICLGLDENTGI